MPSSSSLLELLPSESTVTLVDASSWEGAIRAAGEALVAGGITEPPYTEEMIETVKNLGPYIVIAPGLALAHSRPSPSVLRTGLSWVGLLHPVEFGSSRNDPVRLVIGLAARDHNEHLTAMAQLAALVSDKDRLEQLASLDSPEAVRQAISDFERTTR
ncbi:PTS sugar transporter subunit IIA [Changpingibacter yushuensis]|uniref:PTS sugar transporter subunit IIA n=1 Tax=Changpingibacter yushuensis TaxID=2758440 RepID=UPI0015F3E0A8|nr:PTS sugar transporter subunit IIA [Changpingibacter yushuensis]